MSELGNSSRCYHPWCFNRVLGVSKQGMIVDENPWGFHFASSLVFSCRQDKTVYLGKNSHLYLRMGLFKGHIPVIMSTMLVTPIA